MVLYVIVCFVYVGLVIMLLLLLVLFCCTMNEVRSAMVEGIMKWFHGNRVYVDSVGIQCLECLDLLMVEVMKEIGVDMSCYYFKVFEFLIDDSFDIVIVLLFEVEVLAFDVICYCVFCICGVGVS